MPKLRGAPNDHGGSERPVLRPQGFPPAENLQRRVISAACCPVKSSANGMTTIHEAERSSLEARHEELQQIIAAARLGYCVLEGGSRSLRANAQFKAEFGWAPDAAINLEALEERVAAEYRTGLTDAVHGALTQGADFDLIVQSVWPDGVTQWIALHGRTVNDEISGRKLILTSRNMSSEKRHARRHSRASVAREWRQKPRIAVRTSSCRCSPMSCVRR
jgi:PAS domain-containing protein